jgi:hypothetical protein
MSNNQHFAAVFSASWGDANFALGGLSFRGENPKAYLWWVCPEMMVPNRFLVEDTVWRLGLL